MDLEAQLVAMRATMATLQGQMDALQAQVAVQEGGATERRAEGQEEAQPRTALTSTELEEVVKRARETPP